MHAYCKQGIPRYVQIATGLCFIFFLLKISGQIPNKLVLFEPTEEVFILTTGRSVSPRRGTNIPRVIVDWTSFFGKPIQKPMWECPVNCIYTSNKSQVVNADAVLFHIRDFEPKNIPIIRHSYQRYVFFLIESPVNKPKRLPNGFFNMTMTYRLDSDIVASYDVMVLRNATSSNKYSRFAYSWDQVLNVVSMKTKLVAQLVSNCNTYSKREKYVAELSQYIHVDTFGSCSSYIFKRLCENCDEMLAHDYLFYLAFENSVCQDYVTEKFWRMKNLIVPIVLRQSDYVKIVPIGSFIAVDQFDSPKSLADYLHYLFRNRTEYLKYFEWTKYYWSSPEKDGYFCELCKTLYNDSLPPKTYENMEKWWLEDGKCLNNFAELLLNGSCDLLGAAWQISLLLAIIVFILSVIWRKKSVSVAG